MEKLYEIRLLGFNACTEDDKSSGGGGPIRGSRESEDRKRPY